MMFVAVLFYDIYIEIGKIELPDKISTTLGTWLRLI